MPLVVPVKYIRHQLESPYCDEKEFLLGRIETVKLFQLFNYFGSCDLFIGILEIQKDKSVSEFFRGVVTVAYFFPNLITNNFGIQIT